MGTFHQGKSELHGITVVVDTDGPEIWVGRCDDVVEEGVILNDADVHRDGDGGVDKAAWLQKAALYGVWAKHPRTVVPKDRVTSIRRLSEL